MDFCEGFKDRGNWTRVGYHFDDLRYISRFLFRIFSHKTVGWVSTYQTPYRRWPVDWALGGHASLPESSFSHCLLLAAGISKYYSSY